MATQSDVCTLPYIKEVTNEDLLYITEKSAQHSVMTYMGKESKKDGYMYIYITYMHAYVYVYSTYICIIHIYSICIYIYMSSTYMYNTL